MGCTARLALASLLAGLASIGLGVVERPVWAQAAERQLYVAVVDSTGTPVTGLGPADFVVREDGVVREVLRVGPATAPMQIALLVDTSAASTNPMPEMREAITAFVERMAPGNEIALITFGDRPTISVDYTRSREQLDRGIGRLFATPGSGAYLLDTIVDVARGFERREAGRPVIVAVTTDGIEYSNHQYQTVLQRLGSSGAAFHAVVLELHGANFLDTAIHNRNVVLDQGTASTGGRRDNLLTSMALKGTLEKVATELSSQYLVTYARPEALIPPERVSVEAAKPGLVARGTPVRVQKGA